MRSECVEDWEDETVWWVELGMLPCVVSEASQAGTCGSVLEIVG